MGEEMVMQDFKIGGRTFTISTAAEDIARKAGITKAQFVATIERMDLDEILRDKILHAEAMNTIVGEIRAYNRPAAVASRIESLLEEINFYAASELDGFPSGDFADDVANARNVVDQLRRIEPENFRGIGSYEHHLKELRDLIVRPIAEVFLATWKQKADKRVNNESKRAVARRADDLLKAKGLDSVREFLNLAAECLETGSPADALRELIAGKKPQAALVASRFRGPVRVGEKIRDLGGNGNGRRFDDSHQPTPDVPERPCVHVGDEIVIQLEFKGWDTEMDCSQVEGLHEGVRVMLQKGVIPLHFPALAKCRLVSTGRHFHLAEFVELVERMETSA